MRCSAAQPHVVTRRRGVVAALAAALAGAAVLARSLGPAPLSDRTDSSRSAVRTAPAIAGSPTPVPWADSTLAVVVPDGGGWALAALDAGSRAPSPRRLTERFDELEAPAWSPNGRHLAFAGRRDGNWDVYVVTENGGNPTRLTTDPGFDGAPAWSPDGRGLAFVSSRQGAPAVYRAALDGRDSEAVRLSGGAGPAVDPAWSPDGRWVAYAAWGRGGYRLRVVAAAGGSSRLLTASETGSDLRAPAWSPDGTRLAYIESRHGAGRLVTRLWSSEVGAPGSAPVELAEGVAAFAWFPEGGAVALSSTGRSGRGLAVAPVESAGRDSLLELAPGPARLSWRAGRPPNSAAIAPLVPSPTPPSADPSRRPGTVRLAGVTAPGDRFHADLAADFQALRSDVREQTGRDFLGALSDAWRPLGFKSEGSAFFSWHKTGRAFDTRMELLGPGGRQDMVLVREDVAGRTYWRMFLRAGAQDGSVGRPLVEAGWSFAASRPADDAVTDGGHREARVPAGYWVDFTALAARYGWLRIASLQRTSSDWRNDWVAIEFWHFERRDGLTWFRAIRHLYSDEELAEHLAPERLRALGVPTDRLARLGFPERWPNEG